MPRERAIEKESTRKEERATLRESTTEQERAIVEESTIVVERAIHAESTTRKERASTRERTKTRERAITSESTIVLERAIYSESTKERSDRSVSLKNPGLPLRKLKGDWTSGGHTWGQHGRCNHDCGQTFAEHQKRPTECMERPNATRERGWPSARMWNRRATA